MSMQWFEAGGQAMPAGAPATIARVLCSSARTGVVHWSMPSPVAGHGCARFASSKVAQD